MSIHLATHSCSRTVGSKGSPNTMIHGDPSRQVTKEESRPATQHLGRPRFTTGESDHHLF